MMQEKRDGGGGGGGGCCYYHPKEVVVGVCPLCLHEKLLHLLASSSSSTQRHQYFPSPSKSIINIFTFPSLLNPLHFFHHSNSNLDHHVHDLDTSNSQEDSFISMKIGDNGAGSWEGKSMNVPKKLVFLEHLHVSTKHKSQKVKEERERESNKKSVVEHTKGTRSALRWRKRIGQAFQLVRWKRSNKANVWHVGTKVEGVNVMRKKHKQGWIANLTKKAK